MGAQTARKRRARGITVALILVLLGTAFPASGLGWIPGGPAAPGSPLTNSTKRPVPILMYHVVRRPYPDSPYPALYVPRAELAAQMAWLDRHGYVAVTLRHVWEAWHGRAALPRRPIVISFDDGYRSHYTAALPILRAHGWPAVLNLDLSNLTERWGIRPGQVRALIEAGWEIDAHSLTHADLTALGEAGLQHEVAGSRAELRRRFGVPASFFCYPAGRYDGDVVEAVRAAGFLGATTTEVGLARRSEPFTLDRVRIDGGDGARGLERKLASLGPR